MSQLIKKHRRLTGLLAVLASGIFLLGLTYESQYRGRFYPGVILGGEAVGGMAYGDALTIFSERADALAENGLDLVFENSNSQKEVRVPVFSDGLTPDSLVSYFSFGNWEDAVSRAYSVGRTGSPIRRLADQVSLFVSGKSVDMPGSANKEAIQSLLARELKNFFKTPVPTQFAWDGTKMVIAAGKTGEEVSAEEIRDEISRRLTSFDGGKIYVKAKVVDPDITPAKLQPYLKLANDIAASTRLVFYYGNRSWGVTGTTLASWLTLKDGSDIGIDRSKLEEFLSKTVAPLIDNPPVNSRFQMKDGRLTEIITGKPGNVVDIEKTVQRVEKIVNRVQGSYATTGNLLFALTEAAAQESIKVQSGRVDIPIEITQSDPKITQKTIDQYDIRDLVGFAKTSFKGSSADRRHNIEVGVSKFNGVLLAPGEEFSAVKAIGETTEEAGFVKEYVIKDNKSVKELGGGLCQVATTLFRTALDTGLPITDRTNHKYVVSYYGPGLDATIYGPEPDLRFVNDTGNYLLLQGKIEGNDLTFELYGQRDGRSVEISDPVITDEIPAPPIKYIADASVPFGQTRCSETPHKGMTADVTYMVHYPGGDIKEQNFHSVYQPWQRICLIGTGR